MLIDRKKYLQNLSVFQTVFGTLLIGFITSGIYTLSFESFSFAPLFHDWNVILAFVVLGSGVGYILFYHMIQKGSAEFATMVTYLIPGIAIIWGSLLLNEAIHWTLIIGLVLILSGVFLSGRKPKNSSDLKNLKANQINAKEVSS